MPPRSRFYRCPVLKAQFEFGPRTRTPPWILPLHFGVCMPPHPIRYLCYTCFRHKWYRCTGVHMVAMRATLRMAVLYRAKGHGQRYSAPLSCNFTQTSALRKTADRKHNLNADFHICNKSDKLGKACARDIIGPVCTIRHESKSSCIKKVHLMPVTATRAFFTTNRKIVLPTVHTTLSQHNSCRRTLHPSKLEEYNVSILDPVCLPLLLILSGTFHSRFRPVLFVIVICHYFRTHKALFKVGMDRTRRLRC